MLEVLIVLRDVILITVLSWIGVDFAAQPDAPAEQQQAIKIMMQNEAPVLLITAPAEHKFAIGQETELFRS